MENNPPNQNSGGNPLRNDPLMEKLQALQNVKFTLQTELTRVQAPQYYIFKIFESFNSGSLGEINAIFEKAREKCNGYFEESQLPLLIPNLKNLPISEDSIGELTQLKLDLEGEQKKIMTQIGSNGIQIENVQSLLAQNAGFELEEDPGELISRLDTLKNLFKF